MQTKDISSENLVKQIKILEQKNRELENKLKNTEDELQRIHTLANSDFKKSNEISKRKKMEDKLRESEKKYRRLFNDLNVGLTWSRVSDGKILDCNEYFARLVGYQSRQECIDNYISSEHHTDVSLREKMVYGIKSKGEVKNLEGRVTKKDGSSIWVSFSVHLIQDLDIIEGATIDITKRKEAEQKLRESEIKFRTAVENSPDFIVFVNKHGLILDVNRLEKGLTKEMVLGQSIFNENFHETEEQGESIREAFRVSLESGKRTNYEHSQIIPDGSRSFYETKVSPFEYDNEGNIISFQLTTRDITERKKIEMELRESEEIYRSFVLNIQGIAYHGNEDFSASLFDGMVEEITGYTSEDFTAGRIKWDQLIHPDDLPYMLRKVEIFHSSSIETDSREYRIIRKNREVRWILDKIQKVYSDSKQLSGVRGILIDTTNRKKAEMALKESEERFRKIIEKSEAGYFFIDTHGIFRQVNTAWLRMHKFSNLDEIIGRHFSETQVNIDLSEANRIVKDLLQGAPIPSGEFTRRCKDGTVEYHSFSVNTVVKKGKIIGLEGFLIDTTENRKIEDKLRESEEKFRTLFETMAQGVVYQSANGEILSANPAAEQILGLTIDQMQGRTSVDPRWKAVHEDYSDFPGQTHPSMISLTTGKEVRNVIMGVFNPNDMEYHWININATPQFKSGENTPFQVYTTFEDITESKKAEIDKNKVLMELQEHMKELRCLYSIGEIMEKYENLEEIFRNSVILLPLAWQFPQITCAKITYHNNEYKTQNFRESEWMQSAPIFVKGEKVGSVSVNYLEEKQISFEGPFFKEERKLINNISERLGDVIEKKLAMSQIKRNLQEKDVLLQEIYHRVKNNLQIVSSLLKLQQKNIKNQDFLKILKESEDRIKTISILHENLYISKDFSNIDFSSYIESISKNLYISYGIDPKKVILEIKAQPISIGVDNAIQCGLIVNELISNSLKYAFKKKRGKIKIELNKTEENKIILIIQDNGVGLPSDFNFNKIETLGLRLVKNLVEYNLDGKFKLNSYKGTKAEITFMI